MAEASKSIFGHSPMAHGPSFLLFLICFKANQMGLGWVFDNLTLKHMNALREKIQSPSNGSS